MPAPTPNRSFRAGCRCSRAKWTMSMRRRGGFSRRQIRCLQPAERTRACARVWLCLYCGSICVVVGRGLMFVGRGLMFVCRGLTRLSRGRHPPPPPPPSLLLQWLKGGGGGGAGGKMRRRCVLQLKQQQQQQQQHRHQHHHHNEPLHRNPPKLKYPLCTSRAHVSLLLSPCLHLCLLHSLCNFASCVVCVACSV